MNSKWKIDLEGFEMYVFGEDKNLYRLPFTDRLNKNYALKKIAKCEIKKRWTISRNGKFEKWSQSQLRPHLILDLNPIELFKEIELPF